FDLTNLPSLESIQIDQRSFNNLQRFALANLPQLQSVNLGYFTAADGFVTIFDNLPSLRSITLDDGALDGNWHFDYKINKLTMRNLPSLTQFKGDWHNFDYMGIVVLE
ncbi:hypothetical protein WA538_002989, partial [Blastocystis sp. DL]